MPQNIHPTSGQSWCMRENSIHRTSGDPGCPRNMVACILLPPLPPANRASDEICTYESCLNNASNPYRAAVSKNTVAHKGPLKTRTHKSYNYANCLYINNAPRFADILGRALLYSYNRAIAYHIHVAPRLAMLHGALGYGPKPSDM